MSDLPIEKNQGSDEQRAEKFSLYVESLARKFEVTCDYILEEFLLDF